MKLITRYNRINILFVVLIFIFSAFLLQYFVNKTLVNELDEVLLEIKGRAVNYTDKFNAIPVNSQLDDYIISYNKTNKQISGNNFTTVKKDIPNVKIGHNFRQLKFNSIIGGVPYITTIEKPIEGTKHIAKNIINLTIITVLLLTITLIILNRFLFQSLWKPFYTTLSSINDFQIGKNSTIRFTETKIDEFNYMNTILKSTTQKAEEDYEALKEFTENASHELQTPIAIISSKLDLLIQDEQLTERQEKKITTAYVALKKMSHLNQTLLLSAKIGNQQFSEIKTISLSDKLSGKLNEFKELWQDQLTITADIEPSLIKMNEHLCDTLINNLIINATNHNIKNGLINIVLRPGELIVSNTGKGKPLDAKKLFQRFYKSDQASNGNGLGLAIIKQICDASGIVIKYSFNNNRHEFILTWVAA